MPNIVGVDVGTSSIKALIARKKNDDSGFEILAKTQKPVMGVRKGVVDNTDNVSKTLSECVKDLELQVNQKIDGIYVNISGNHISSEFSKGLVSVSRADQKISSEDMDRVIQAAKTFSLSKNYEILEVFPKEYIIDGGRSVKDPSDMHGVRLEAEVLIIQGFSPYFKNTIQAVLDAGLQSNDVIVTPMAAARSILTPREKERGVFILDIGSSTSSMAVFEEGNIIHVAVFPIGSDNITNDIAIGLKTDIDTAEKIKLNFGNCLSSKNDKKKEKINSIESGNEIIFTRFFLRKIIEARISEIFDLTKDELKKILKIGELPAGLVLTGGGSLMPNIIELAKKEIKLPCRIGHPNDFNPIIEDPSFAVAAGLVMYGDEIEEDHGGSDFGKKLIKKIKKIAKLFIP